MEFFWAINLQATNINNHQSPYGAGAVDEATFFLTSDFGFEP